MLTTAEIAPSLRPGMHAATFGGNPIAAVAGIATLEMIESENLLARAVQLGDQFETRMNQLAQQCDHVREVRVMGLMIGIELTVDGAPVVKQCMDKRLLVNCTQGNVIRLLPALTLTDEQAEEGCEILTDVIKQL